MYRVYRHICPDNSFYIGVTNQPYNSQRFKNGKGYELQTFYEAILTFGWDNIKHEVVAETNNRKEALTLEHDLILEMMNEGYTCWNQYKTNIPDHKSSKYIDADTGETFSSFAEIGRVFGISRQSARLSVLNGTKTSGHNIMSMEKYNEQKEKQTQRPL